MADKPKKTVKRKTVTKSPEVLASETLMAVVMSDSIPKAAEVLGITRQQVYWRIDEYDLSDKIKALKNQALLELHAGATKAALNLIAKIDSDNDSVSKAASDSILDRIGLTKSDNGDSKGDTFNFINGNASFNTGKYKD